MHNNNINKENCYEFDRIEELSESNIRDLFEDIEYTEKMTEPKSTNTNEICKKCNTADHIIIDTVQGFRVCTSCGQVLDTLFDQNPEWRSYDDEKDSGRCTMSVNKLLPQSSLGTTISGGTFRNRIKTIHVWNAMPYRERSLNSVFKEIQNRCSKGGLVKCIEDDAKIMYKTISECKHLKGKNKGKYIIIRGTNRKSLIAACVFFACKKKGMTRSPKEISELFNIKYAEITKGCKNFSKLVKIRKLGLNLGMSLPEHFIIRFCNELKLKKVYQDETLKISNNISRLNIGSDHTPFSIATGSILLMAENNGLTSINRRRLADKFGISEVTITKTHKKLYKYRHILLSNELTEKILSESQKENTIENIPTEVKDRMKKFGVKINNNDWDTEIDDKLDVSDDFDNNVEINDDVEEWVDNILFELYNKLDNIKLNFIELCNNHNNLMENI